VAADERERQVVALGRQRREAVEDVGAGGGIEVVDVVEHEHRASWERAGHRRGELAEADARIVGAGGGRHGRERRVLGRELQQPGDDPAGRAVLLREVDTQGGTIPAPLVDERRLPVSRGRDDGEQARVDTASEDLRPPYRRTAPTHRARR